MTRKTEWADLLKIEALRRKRRWFTISYDKKAQHWVCKERGRASLYAFQKRKFYLVSDVADILKNAWVTRSHPSELTIKGKDGKIQDRRTYGLDPRKSKG